MHIFFQLFFVELHLLLEYLCKRKFCRNRWKNGLRVNSCIPRQPADLGHSSYLCRVRWLPMTSRYVPDSAAGASSAVGVWDAVNNDRCSPALRCRPTGQPFRSLAVIVLFVDDCHRTPLACLAARCSRCRFAVQPVACELLYPPGGWTAAAECS